MRGFELELKKSLRTKKFWLILVLILLIYAMAFREVGNNLESATNPLSGIGYITVSAFIFIVVYTLIAGATSVKTLRTEWLGVSSANPLGGYRTYLANSWVRPLVVAIIFATLLSFAITKYYGLSRGGLGSLQPARAFGYAPAPSPWTADFRLRALFQHHFVIFFVTGLVMPQIVDGFAKDKT